MSDSSEQLAQTIEQLGLPIEMTIDAIACSDGKAYAEISVPLPPGAVDEVRQQVVGALTKLDGISAATVEIISRITPRAVQGKLSPLARIANVIAVASGKGGVGKSTVAVNLALGLKSLGATVGLLDADIYGPSQPLLLDAVDQQVELADEKTMRPLEAYGISFMSIGALVGDQAPMVWRGPMVSSALQQMLNQTAWGRLDYLIIDLPPGTGDTQLTMAQKIPIAGAVIVTTPQNIALSDAQRGVEMFRKLDIAVLGVVENMSMHTCSNCGHQEAIFGSDGGERMAASLGVELLAKLPLSIDIRADGDRGQPSVLDTTTANGAAFAQLATNTAIALANRPRPQRVSLKLA